MRTCGAHIQVALCWAGALAVQPTDSPSALVNLTSLDTVLVAESLMYRLIDVSPDPDTQKSRMLQDRCAGQTRSAQHTQHSVLRQSQNWLQHSLHGVGSLDL